MIRRLGNHARVIDYGFASYRCVDCDQVWRGTAIPTSCRRQKTVEQSIVNDPTDFSPSVGSGIIVPDLSNDQTALVGGGGSSGGAGASGSWDSGSSGSGSSSDSGSSSSDSGSSSSGD